jgi:hypothetical protein
MLNISGLLKDYDLKVTPQRVANVDDYIKKKIKLFLEIIK